MIQLNELRVGSLVELGGSIEQVFGVLQNGEIHLCGNAVINYPEQLNGASISVGILESSRFKEINGYFVNADKEDCHIALLPASDRFNVMTSGPFGMVTLGAIRHLHQLQNLYFVLTGKELEIKMEAVNSATPVKTT